MKSKPRDPFEVDPEKVDRGNLGHRKTQNALAAYVKGLGYAALRPIGEDPDFDVAWEAGG